MADTVDTFRRIVFLVSKWLLVCVIGLVGLTGAIAADIYGYHYWTYVRHAANIEYVVNTETCKDDEYPVFVGFENRSMRKLERVSFRLVGKRTGRSTDIAEYQTYSDDYIINPKAGRGMCWRAPLRANIKENPRTLECSVHDAAYTFGD